MRLVVRERHDVRDAQTQHHRHGPHCQAAQHRRRADCRSPGKSNTHSCQHKRQKRIPPWTVLKGKPAGQNRNKRSPRNHAEGRQAFYQAIHLACHTHVEHEGTRQQHSVDWQHKHVDQAVTHNHPEHHGVRVPQFAKRPTHRAQRGPHRQNVAHAMACARHAPHLNARLEQGRSRKARRIQKTGPLYARRRI